MHITGAGGNTARVTHHAAIRRLRDRGLLETTLLPQDRLVTVRYQTYRWGSWRQEQATGQAMHRREALRPPRQRFCSYARVAIRLTPLGAAVVAAAGPDIAAGKRIRWGHHSAHLAPAAPTAAKGD
jgi:hypothetical protein